MSLITRTVNHLKLLDIDSESIFKLFCLYDQYENEVLVRAEQLEENIVGTVDARRVDLKFWVVTKFLTTSIALGFITGVTLYEDLTDNLLCAHLDKEASKSRTTVTLSSAGSIFNVKLKIDTKNSDANSRMSNLIVAIHSFFRSTGQSCLHDTNEKIAIQHVPGAIQPAELRKFLCNVLSFPHACLKKTFRAFSNSLR